MLDDLHETLSIHVDEGFLNGPVVAVAEEYATPGDADPLARTVAEVAEDDLKVFPVRVDHDHGGKGIYLHKLRDMRDCPGWVYCPTGVLLSSFQPLPPQPGSIGGNR